MIKNEDITKWETEAGNLTAYPLTAALSPGRYKKKKTINYRGKGIVYTQPKKAAES